MSRRRTLRVLFARPAFEHPLPRLFAFSDRLPGPQELPVRLLRLATTAKLGSPHRIFLHDAAHAPDGNRSLRRVVRVHAADVVLVEVHPAQLPDALAAARAARDGGAEVVLATGPFVDRWPAGLSSLIEFDGLLPSAAGANLLGALSSLCGPGRAVDLQRALEGPHDLPPPDARGLDRKLLDYARYRAVPQHWRAPGGGRLDKGRHAASAVLLHDELGRCLPAAEVRAELAECALLGIPHLTLEAGGHPDRPDPELLRDVLTAAQRPGGERGLPWPAQTLAAADLAHFAQLGVRAFDLGDRPAAEFASGADVDAFIAARQSGIAVVGRVLFGLGPSRDEEEGLASLRRARCAVEPTIAMQFPPSPTDDAYPAWLDAPRADFTPPWSGGETTRELAERAQILLGALSSDGVVRASLRRMTARVLDAVQGL